MKPNDMILSGKQLDSLELARVMLASLAIWLVVISVVTCDATAPSPTTAATIVSSPVPVGMTNPEIASDREPILAAPQSGARSAQLLSAVDEPDAQSPQVAGAADVGVLSLAPTGFAFPADLGGQILSERLIPPAQFDVPPVPFVSQPQPWQGLRFDPLPRDVPPLTATVVPREARPASQLELAGLSSSSSFDFPSLPRDSTPASIEPIRFHPQPRTFVASADPIQVPALPILSAPPKENISPSLNPARHAADTWLFTLRATVPAAPAEFIRLLTAHPFEQFRAVRLTHPIADLDPPLFPTGRPSQPPLGRGNSVGP
jgi:hypothetical protein